MICPACFGQVYRNGLFPCDVCESRGVIHCCEGDSATNDPVFDVKREHVASTDCWCGPIEVEARVFPALPGDVTVG